MSRTLKTNRVLFYENEIYKEAKMTQNLSFTLSQKALGKTTKTQSLLQDSLGEYQKKQISAIQKPDGMINLLKDLSAKNKNATKLNQILY